jgi:hypothetical protein
MMSTKVIGYPQWSQTGGIVVLLKPGFNYPSNLAESLVTNGYFLIFPPGWDNRPVQPRNCPD